MPTESANAPRSQRPMGRDEVVTAILEAAADLFAARGPAATALRDVADAAGVNHGLIHRHIGGKDELVVAVLDYLGATVAGLLSGGAPSELARSAADRQVGVWSRTILDGYPTGDRRIQFPNVHALIGAAQDHHGDEARARLLVANVVALRLGWQLFGAALADAAELADIPEPVVTRSVSEARDRILGFTPDPRLVIPD